VQTNITFGWRMPMWDPAGAPLATWLPGIRQNLDALPVDVFQTVWQSDHLVPGAGWAPPEWDTLECMTALIHFATAYPQFRYGQIVLGNSYRPPSLLAKMFSTLQGLTGVRCILGIGAGWMESEYRMYGYEMPRPAIRIQQLDEACQIIRRMWTESPASFEGKHYTIDQAFANPLPSPIPPIMIGGSGEQLTMRVIAKHADWWETGSQPIPEYKRKSGVLAQHCEAVGRDPSSILHVSQCQVVSIADSEASAIAIAEKSLLYHHTSEAGRLVGTPEQVLAKLEERMDAGVRHFIVRFMDFPHTDQALRFAAEIAPKLRARHGS
jgi:alkanesulfonate monooxygenase SsuD/methylene tetrahydromethanopterin reductase-like flavin-dependent oxidoreductase (luciferase family)